MDNLEKFIRENRKKFDRYHPRHKVWSGISSEAGMTFRPPYLRIAAALALILTGLAVIYHFTGNKTAILSYKGNTEVNEAVTFYTQRFHSLYQLSLPTLGSHPGLEIELTNDIALLDSITSEIRKDLKDNANNTEVIEALIQNYRTRLMILEEMLTILDENQNDNEKNNREL